MLGVAVCAVTAVAQAWDTPVRVSPAEATRDHRLPDVAVAEDGTVWERVNATRRSASCSPSSRGRGT